MKTLLVFLFAVYCAESIGQRIDGTYFGDIISPRNTMIIKNKDEHLTGTIYLNESDTLNFSGAFAKNILNATVYSKEKRAIVLEGKLEKNAMWLKVLPDSNRIFLNKVSNKTSYKIKRLYSENMDPMLLGRWESIKSVNNKGEISDGKMAYTYFDNNRKNVQILTIPSGVHRSGTMSDAQVLSGKTEYSWERNGNQLTENFIWPPNVNPQVVSRYGGLPTVVHRYVIKQDTLTLFGEHGGYLVLKKK